MGSFLSRIAGRDPIPSRNNIDKAEAARISTHPTHANLIPLTTDQKLHLEQFRQLVGIHSSYALTRNDNRRPIRKLSGRFQHTPNEGLYKRILSEEHRARNWYFFTAGVINLSLFLQIAIAAVITAISASLIDTVPTTILGAINTALAGILAYMRGQGLPTRFVLYRAEIRRVREFIELRERQFQTGVAVDGHALDPETVAAEAQTLWDDARKDEENNEPENYVKNAKAARVYSGFGSKESEMMSNTGKSRPLRVALTKDSGNEEVGDDRGQPYPDMSQEQPLREQYQYQYQRPRPEQQQPQYPVPQSQHQPPSNFFSELQQEQPSYPISLQQRQRDSYQNENQPPQDRERQRFSQYSQFSQTGLLSGEDEDYPHRPHRKNLPLQQERQQQRQQNFSTQTTERPSMNEEPKEAEMMV